MNVPLNALPLFILSLCFGIAMLVEGFLILKLHKQITPLPTRILYWVSVGLTGKERSGKWFAGKNTPDQLRAYAFFALLFGSCLLISSFIYLGGILS